MYLESFFWVDGLKKSYDGIDENIYWGNEIQTLGIPEWFKGVFFIGRYWVGW